MLVEPSELTEVIWVMPGISENCRSERRGDVGGHGLGAGAGQGGADLDGREVHLRQRRHRQQGIADDADQQEGRRQQRGGDGPADEGTGEIHGVACFWHGRDPDQRAGLQDHLPVGDHDSPGLTPALDHDRICPGSRPR